MEELKLAGDNGLNVLVSGSIPPAAGLSSSSALVCASALVTAHLLSAAGSALSRSALARVSASAERWVGTEGGGMDQAIAMLATRGAAQCIHFSPLKAVSVKLPPGMRHK